MSLFCDQWNELTGNHIAWENVYDGGPHEANFLKLDCSKLKRVFNWKPRWNVEMAMQKIIEWNQEYTSGKNISECMDRQINDFLKVN